MFWCYVSENGHDQVAAAAFASKAEGADEPCASKRFATLMSVLDLPRVYDVMYTHGFTWLKHIFYTSVQLCTTVCTQICTKHAHISMNVRLCYMPAMQRRQLQALSAFPSKYCWSLCMLINSCTNHVSPASCHDLRPVGQGLRHAKEASSLKPSAFDSRNLKPSGSDTARQKVASDAHS